MTERRLRLKIVAYVRKRGAIGLFETVSFFLDLPHEDIKLNHDTACDLWADRFSADWELNGIKSYGETLMDNLSS